MRAETLTPSRTPLALLPAARTALWAGMKGRDGSGAGGHRVVAKYEHGVRTMTDREPLLQTQANVDSEIQFYR